jgi:hypothetical protein
MGYSFTVLKNNVATALTVKITSPGTQEIDTADTVSVVAGDEISLQCAPQNSPTTTANAHWSIMFEGSTAGESVVLSGIEGYTSTLYAPVMTANGYSGSLSEADVLQVMPTAGTFKKLYVLYPYGPGVGASWKFTLRKNSVDTALTVTISGATASGNDTADTVSVVAGDIVTMSCVVTGSPTAQPGAISMVFAPTIDGESIIMGDSNDAAHDNTAFETNYLGPTDYDQVYTVAGNEFVDYQGGQSPPLGMILKKFYVAQTSASGAGATWKYDIRCTGDTNTGITVSISGALATTGNDTTNTYKCVDYDRLHLGTTPTSTPTVSQTCWSVVCYIAPKEPLPMFFPT